MLLKFNLIRTKSLKLAQTLSFFLELLSLFLSFEFFSKCRKKEAALNTYIGFKMLRVVQFVLSIKVRYPSYLSIIFCCIFHFMIRSLSLSLKTDSEISVKSYHFVVGHLSRKQALRPTLMRT